ncbi:g-type lectin s-receptor-like serine/threonine-protein kinase [Quercus suber]|uniref:G-type lectin s-receptor-like serine/threonine-protein kinase n=1 Tax=Quercus suber TaxID=58331 RepID=A0AAW0IVA2_QUESU
MGMSWDRRGVLLYLSLSLIHFSFVLPRYYSSDTDQPLYNLQPVQFRDGSTVRILHEGGSSNIQGPGFALGFFCNQSSDRYLLSIFILFYKSFDEIQDTVGPQVVWSANQTNPVSNATVRLSSDGGLVVQEADGTIVWTTNINSEYRPILNLTDTGNLQLLGDNGSTVWQSFDHPSDSLLLGQKLSVGQKLTSAASATYQIERGLFSLSLDIDGLFAFRQSNEGPERYYHHDSFSTSYVQFMNGSLSFFTVDDKLSGPYKDFLIPSALSSWQYMRFESDGHLRVYEWKQQSLEWKEVADLLTADIGNCGYPTVCDGYSICSNGKCSCPEPKNDRRYFQQINDSQPGRGCSLVTPLSCEASLNQNFLELKNITSVTFRQDLEVDSESCKEACLKNCLCKAAIFQKYTWGSFVGFCYLPSQNFSLKHAEVNDSYISTTYIKVQNVPRAVPSPEQKNHGKKINHFIIIVGSGVASLFGLFILIGIFFHLFRKNKDSNEAEEYYLDHVPGMPTRYSFADLQLMTENFKKNIGAGGFGTVFEGALIDGTKPEEAMHLLGFFKEKLQKKQLLDLVDKYNEDMQLHGAEVVDMMKVAAWCLQSDFTKRPSMSVVVKVLEGVVDVEENIEHNFCNPPISNPRARVMYHEVNVGNATALLDSVLSGPR